MAALNVRQFVQCLSDSGLFSAEDLESVRARVPSADLSKDAQDLARDLVRQGTLTRYQAALLYQGKSKALLLGNYVVLDKLGQGGMGMVLKARHRRMLRTVAIKVLPPAVVKSATALKRFQREAQAAAKLSHPNIVAAYDADEAGGVHFLVMEYVEGQDLGELIKRDGPFSVDKALYCVREAARGLAYAHEKGVIHRDIKPANLLLAADGALKILDMGLARIDEGLSGTAETEDGLTKTGQIMGTVDYMAPEQAEDTRRADARADIYSLGCTLYRLLVDEPVYMADTLMLKLLAHREHAIPDLRARRADAPPELQATFARMVAKKPADRFQTMDEVLAALNGATPAPPAPPVLAPIPAPPVVAARSMAGESNADLHGFLSGLSAPARGVATRAAAATQTLAGLSAGHDDTLRGAFPASAAPTPATRRLMLGACVTGGVVVAMLLVGMIVSSINGSGKSKADSSAATVQDESASQDPDGSAAPPQEDLAGDSDPASGRSKAILAAESLPPNADDDFNIQGEYLLAFPRRKSSVGVQVVALGDGAFQIVTFDGGLPGAGADLRERRECQGRTTNGAARFTLPRGAKAIVRDGFLTLLGKTTEQVKNSERLQRVSSAAGRARPTDAAILFDGHSTGAWINGRMTPDNLLLPGCVSQQKFRDFTLFFEFRLPYLPTQRGQARGNSGCYLQGRYELQLLDSFGLKEADNGCGALYGLRAPDVNMCFPPYAWQTMEIEFTAARYDAQGRKTQNAKVTALHNGVTIHRDVLLPNATVGGQPEADSPGPITFQNHGSDVCFRNVWIVDRSNGAAADGQPPTGAASGGFKPIFNGHSLAGWQGDPKLWSVQYGVLVGSTQAAPIAANAYLVADGEYQNFILRASFKLEDGNSGIQFRSRRLANGAVAGYQVDIADNALMGALYEERGRGRLAGSEGGQALSAYKPGDWNELEVTARGNRVQIKLNGAPTVDYREEAKRLADKGIIALQLHTGPKMKVQFKDLWICELPE